MQVYALRYIAHDLSLRCENREGKRSVL